MTFALQRKDLRIRAQDPAARAWELSASQAKVLVLYLYLVLDAPRIRLLGSPGVPRQALDLSRFSETCSSAHVRTIAGSRQSWDGLLPRAGSWDVIWTLLLVPPRSGRARDGPIEGLFRSNGS